MSAKTFHPGKLALYIGLSLTDLFLTYQLLQQSQGEVYEGNPIANAWLSSYGWAGLILFKVLTMALAGGAAIFVSVYHPQWGGYILKFACGTLVLVVIYSFSLIRTMGAEPDPQTERALQLDGEIAVHRQYDMVMEELRQELIAGQATLPEAVSRLRECQKAHSPIFLQYLHEHRPGCTDDECFAGELVDSVLAYLQNQPLKKASFTRRLQESRSAPAVTTASLTNDKVEPGR